jgi:hypothetical protein
MPAKRQSTPDLETNTSPGPLQDDLRRTDPPETPPDSIPPTRVRDTKPAGGGFTPKEDGGVDQHPVHDDDQEDATPADFEEAIARLDATSRER